MARVAKATKTTTPAIAPRKPGRPPKSATKVAMEEPVAAAKPGKGYGKTAAKPVAAKSAPAKSAPVKSAPAKPAATKSAAPKSAVAQKPAAPAKPVASPPVRAPKLSKDELRAQVEKLEQANAAFRSKSRETNKALKLATRRITELEEQVTLFEQDAKPEPEPEPAPAPAKRGPKPKAATAGRGKRQSRSIDAGDAVPGGVATDDPAPMDEDAEAALDKLNEHLDGD